MPATLTDRDIIDAAWQAILASESTTARFGALLARVVMNSLDAVDDENVASQEIAKDQAQALWELEHRLDTVEAERDKLKRLLSEKIDLDDAEIARLNGLLAEATTHSAAISGSLLACQGREEALAMDVKRLTAEVERLNGLVIAAEDMAHRVADNALRRSSARLEAAMPENFPPSTVAQLVSLDAPAGDTVVPVGDEHVEQAKAFADMNALGTGVLHVANDGSATHVPLRDAILEDEQPKELTALERVVKAWKEGRRGPFEISKAANVPQASVYAHLSKARMQGLIPRDAAVAPIVNPFPPPIRIVTDFEEEEVEGPNGKSIVAPKEILDLLDALKGGAPVHLAKLQSETMIPSRKIRDKATLYRRQLETIGLSILIAGDHATLCETPKG